MINYEITSNAAPAVVKLNAKSV